MTTDKTVNGCEKCESLMNQFAAIVDECATFLREYHAALHTQDIQRIDEMRDRVAEYDLTRVLAREALLTHQAAHNGKIRPTHDH